MPLLGCAPQVNDPSAGLAIKDAVALIDRAPRSEVKLQEVAMAYAFGTRVSNAQRAALDKALIGHAVEWDLPVSDVGYAEDRFALATSAIPLGSHDAVPRLRVAAFVIVRDEADQRFLMKVRTDQVVRVRGIVQEIRGGTVVAIVPAVVVDTRH